MRGGAVGGRGRVRGRGRPASVGVESSLGRTALRLGAVGLAAVSLSGENDRRHGGRTRPSSSSVAHD